MQNNEPLMSIVMTAYNAEDFINASISAALAQTYTKFEVIVVDDGSEDETGNICRNIKDERLLYIEAGRLGRSRALNEGIKAARGEYIAINDADDLSFPTRLEILADVFRKSKQEISLFATLFTETPCFMLEIPKHVLKTVTKQPRCIIWYGGVDLYRDNPLNHSTVAYPKTVWERVGGYNENLKICVDYDFYLKALQFGKLAHLQESTLLTYRNPISFFKKRNAMEYMRTLFIIKRQARKQLNLPIWVRIYDLIPPYLALRTALRNLRPRRTKVNC